MNCNDCVKDSESLFRAKRPLIEFLDVQSLLRVAHFLEISLFDVTKKYENQPDQQDTEP